MGEERHEELSKDAGIDREYFFGFSKDKKKKKKSLTIILYSYSSGDNKIFYWR